MDTLSGWRPADADESPQATSWRARKALERSARHDAANQRQDEAIEQLAGNVNVLSATITAWQTEGARRWEVSGKLAKWVGGIAGAIVVGRVTLFLIDWFATFHH
jgi:hypothetical protein